MTKVAMDFGTFNSAVAYRLLNGGVEFLKLNRGDDVIPSFLLVRDGELKEIGSPAKAAWPTDPEHVVWGLKRLLGLDYHGATEREKLDRFNYGITDCSGKLRIQRDGQVLAPIDLVAGFMRRIREQLCDPQNDSATRFSEPPESLVLAHPAYFDSQQIGSLQQAAKLAGYTSVQLIREPEAAAMAYKDRIDFTAAPLVMVIDWGAGTLDFFIAHFFLGDDGRPKVVETVPAYGDAKLGGLDIDDALVQRFKDLNGISDLPAKDGNLLRSTMEDLKIGLSRRDSGSKFVSLNGRPYSVRLCRNSVPSGAVGQWISLEHTVTDKAYGDLLGRFREHLHHALKIQNLSTRDIDSIILVGGPMCMPCARAAVAEEFADNNGVLQQLAHIETEGFPVDPFKAVAWGAALSDEVDAGPTKLQFTYGFLMDGDLVEDLVFEIAATVARGRAKTAVHDGTIQIRAGEFVDIALYKAGGSPDGTWHRSLGHYPFAPVAAQGRGTSVVPSMRVEDGVFTLIMQDRISGNVLTLPFVEGKEQSLPSRPAVMELLSHDYIEGLSITDPDRYRMYTEFWNQGAFSAEEVDKQRQKSVVLHKTIQQCIHSGRKLPQGADQLFTRLGVAIPRVQQGMAIAADSPEAKVFQELLNARNELMQALRNESFEY